MTLARLLTEQTRLGDEVEQFQAAMGRARSVFRDLDLSILPDDSFLPTLRDVRTLLDRAGSLLLSGSLAFLTSHLALTSVIGRALPQSAASIAQSLSTGVELLTTVAPAIDLALAAASFLDDPPASIELDRLFGEGRALSSDEVLRRIPAGPARRALVRFFSSHGHRSIAEEDLTQPRWREDATPVLAMLTSLRRLPSSLLHEPESVLSRGRALADRELARLEERLSFFELGLARALAERAQRFSKLREALWTTSSDALSMARTVALEIDRRLLRVNPRLDPGAVFYCTHEELMTALATGRPEVDHLVNLRRAELQRDLRRADPPPIYVGSPVPFVVPPSGDAVLRGMPASPGFARGTARVVREMDSTLAEFRPGDILVTRSLDLGLAPLMFIAGGIVTEQGGPLSHSLVVARAFGLPAVVHVAAATLVFRSGETLRVDGDIGSVERVPSIAN
jgi:pyruvate,water dikinase